MTNPTDERGKIAAMEGLRGIMALWVVVGHISLTVGWKLPLLDRNTLAVDVFILLSGFVIALLVDKKREDYRRYIVRRAFRIFPLYLGVLFVSALILPMAMQAWTMVPFETVANAKRLELAQIANGRMLEHVAIHIPLLQGILPASVLPGAPWTVVGQAWSVSLEWQFYLIAPAMIWGLATPRRAVVTLMGMVILTASSRWFTPAFLGYYIWHFGIGIASYMFLGRREIKKFASGLIAACSIVVVYRGGPWQLVPLTCWAGVIYVVLRPRGAFKILNDLLTASLAVRLGELSYSVYVLHMIPLTIFVWLLNPLGLSTSVYSSLLFCSVVLTTYGLSVVTHRWIEKPGIRAGAFCAQNARGTSQATVG